MLITYTQLRMAMPHATPMRCEEFLDSLNSSMTRYGITTPMRIAHFLAQIAWESGSLRYTEEIASGAAYDTGKLAQRLGNTPEKDGDGQRFKGRGLIQLTGKANYTSYGNAVGMDFTSDDRWLLLKEPHWACDSAGWFWRTHGLNELADRDEFTKITRIINGSTKTVKKRLPYLGDAKRALNLLKR